MDADTCRAGSTLGVSVTGPSGHDGSDQVTGNILLGNALGSSALCDGFT